MKKILAGIISIILIGLLFTYFSQKPTSRLDTFLKQNNATAEVAKAYRIAYKNPQNVLSKVKCYCGCLKNQVHKNNRDCFINDDGSFDLMGLNCGLCVKTALISKQMLDEGKSVQEISDFVDSKFGKID